MAKNKKTVELKAKVDKVSEAHLRELQEIINNINTIQFNIGKMEANKHSALHDLAVAQDRVGVMQDTLQKEYGTFDINLLSGEINWPKDEK